MASEKKKVAMILGASGIFGWALMCECLSYPSTATFSRVISLSKRPMSRKRARLQDDPRLEIHTGLDLTDADLPLQRLDAIPDVDAYTSYESDPEDQVKTNATIVNNALTAVKDLCPNLKFVSLQTGGKGYGTVGYGWPPAPWKEDLARLPEPYASKIFYLPQCDVVARHATDSLWKWTDVRPSLLLSISTIPGFVPQFSAMNVAQSLGPYLSFYRSMYSYGAACPFPGTQESWRALHTDSFQDLVARFHIYASLYPDKTHERPFNVGDGDSVSWEMKWRLVCQYFGLDGPDWVFANGLERGALENVNWDILAATLASPMRIDYDLRVSRDIGFSETMEPGRGYILAFDWLIEANFLPRY
ncbi:uncharacterized protein BDZ83DRAFT_719430 [Colletotrichum acutatum]|uniref:PRISE-like Rossmann-fold domain-containing protein n=1 Tax=Glomerella acutata TaxID=27357 RepID=A0AAD8XHT1_GLOAC|nr:uncharacterized protein BDZ83DRAFT_719430 [Colletotrichum acutatum]KAK1725203.1 hypothetical protein BDZ83DRAFT_719430 [Colletotrichum acutatum]